MDSSIAPSVAPLVAAHLPRDHPLITRDYSLFTPAIAQMVDTIARWLDDQVDGAVIFGPSRFGKSSAVDHWLLSLLSEAMNFDFASKGIDEPFTEIGRAHV